MVVQGQARVDTSFVQTMIEFNTGVQNKLELTSDIDFSGKIIMCMQMVGGACKTVKIVNNYHM